MKRLGSSDSLGGLMSICKSTAAAADQDHQHSSSPRKSINHQAGAGVGLGLGVGYSQDFQPMMLDGLVDEDGCLEDSVVVVGGHVSEKKRRLSVEQVKALEKNFEVENKLEPERKVKLAQELGLQPRQVAVWFQNRRARWKTKQLERDYGVLKANYDSLKQSFEELKQDNEALLKEIRVLKSKLNNDDQEIDNLSVKEEEAFGTETDNPAPLIDAPETEPGPVPFKSMARVLQLAPELKVVVDGPSDSDSSTIPNEENNSTTPPNNNNNNNNHHSLLELELDLDQLDPFSPTSTITTNTPANNFCRFNSSSPSSITTYFNHHQSTTDVILGGAGDDHFHHPTTTTTTILLPFVKMEEQDFFNEEIEMDQEACCNFFLEDQAPTLHHLYCASADQ